MSNWTHVAGIIRIDDLRLNDPNDFDKYFNDLIGKECRFTDDARIWKDQAFYPNDYLPMGSEGSLRKSVWINPDRSNLAAYTVSIFGDLRDHDDPQAIIDWFENKCEKLGLSVRQAVITVQNEVYGTLSYTYQSELMT